MIVMTEPEQEFDDHPITKQYVAEMEQVRAAARDAGDPGQAIAQAFRLFASIGHAIAALEGEVVLLRRLVHGDDPNLRLH